MFKNIWYWKAMLHCNGALAFLNFVLFFSTWMPEFLAFAAITTAGASYSHYILGKDFSDD